MEKIILAEESSEINIGSVSNRLITPANFMTAGRPILAATVAEMLKKGERPVVPIVIAMAVTDMDGKVARFFDKHFPDLEIGTSNIGALGDPLADTLSILTISTAAMSAPRISIPSKFAIASVLGQEGFKSAWAIKSAYHYKYSTKSEESPKGKKLVLPVLDQGKKAMAAKLIAIVCAVSTNDIDDPRIKRGLDFIALSCAGFGTYNGEMVRRKYNEQYKNMIDIV